jgi:hypothetical protein
VGGNSENRFLDTENSTAVLYLVVIREIIRGNVSPAQKFYCNKRKIIADVYLIKLIFGKGGIIRILSSVNIGTFRIHARSLMNSYNQLRIDRVMAMFANPGIGDVSSDQEEVHRYLQEMMVLYSRISRSTSKEMDGAVTKMPKSILDNIGFAIATSMNAKVTSDFLACCVGCLSLPISAAISVTGPYVAVISAIGFFSSFCIKKIIHKIKDRNDKKNLSQILFLAKKIKSTFENDRPKLQAFYFNTESIGKFSSTVPPKVSVYCKSREKPWSQLLLNTGEKTPSTVDKFDMIKAVTCSLLVRLVPAKLPSSAGLDRSIIA